MGRVDVETILKGGASEEAYDVFIDTIEGYTCIPQEVQEVFSDTQLYLDLCSSTS